jgi:UDP-N-acetylmuramoyl-L-alanyl-D-glutamate--2,6-diaminopimelate ligase
MGRIAAQEADTFIATSDNPRHEPRDAIVDQMLSGLSEAERRTVVVELDREAAITSAVALAGPADVVVIAGKGHETTQIEAGITSRFVDQEKLAEALGVSWSEPQHVGGIHQAEYASLVGRTD